MSGDAPDTMPYKPNTTSSNKSMADKAKFNAWKSKRGMTQEHAMMRYSEECERQLRLYGNSSSDSNTSEEAKNKMNSKVKTSKKERNSIPRGIAAVPLLCAAAAETLEAYKARVLSSSIQPSRRSGWWRHQEPLCADPGTLLAFPEHAVIYTAQTFVEQWVIPSSTVPTATEKVLIAASYPIHNILIASWVVFIYICTLMGSAAVIAKTLVLGKKRVQSGSIPDILEDTIEPLASSTLALNSTRQALSIRLIGFLVGTPMRLICRMSSSIASAFMVDDSKSGINSHMVVVAALFHTWACVFTWFYWLCVVPWAAVLGILWIGIGLGVCYGIIELAEV